MWIFRGWRMTYRNLELHQTTSKEDEPFIIRAVNRSWLHAHNENVLQKRFWSPSNELIFIRLCYLPPPIHARSMETCPDTLWFGIHNVYVLRITRGSCRWYIGFYEIGNACLPLLIGANVSSNEGRKAFARWLNAFLMKRKAATTSARATKTKETWTILFTLVQVSQSNVVLSLFFFSFFRLLGFQNEHIHIRVYAHNELQNLFASDKNKMK